MDDKIAQENKTHNAVVETYAEDMAKVLGNDTQGLIKKIIHGEEKHAEEQKNLSPESKKNKFFMFVSITLLMFAFGTLAYFFFEKSANTVPVEKQFVPIISSDQSIYLEISNLSKDQIEQTVLNEINTIKVSGLEGIYLTINKQMIGLRQFITLIKGNFIAGESTLFVSDNFLMGVVKTADNQASPVLSKNNGFFILLKDRSIPDIFNSLRSWESKMLSDLHGFLGIDIGSDTNYLLTKGFQDGIVENKNARILYDKDGNLVLMYIFADDDSVIITNSQDSAHEIILRLASGRTQQ